MCYDIRKYVYIQEEGLTIVRKKFTTSLDEQIIQKLKIQAVKESTNVSKILEKLIRNYLSDKEGDFNGK